MTTAEREILIAERDALNERLKGEFVNPKDMRRKEQITSLLLTDGASEDVRFVGKRSKDGNRVTSFTRDRR